MIEAGRVAAVRGAPDARVYIRIFPHKSVTSTPEETRMGTGKGEPDYWCAVVKPGTILYEVGGGVTEEIAREGPEQGRAQDADQDPIREAEGAGMRPRDIRRRDDQDLRQEMRRLEEEIFQQRFHGQSEEKVDRGLVRKHRRDIARIKTILRARELGQESAPGAE